PELLDAHQHFLVRVISAELRARAGELRAACPAHLAVLIHQGVGQTRRPLACLRPDRDTVLLGHLGQGVEVNRARVLEGLVHAVSEELPPRGLVELVHAELGDRKSTRLNSSHVSSSYAVFCLTKQASTTA